MTHLVNTLEVFIAPSKTMHSTSTKDANRTLPSTPPHETAPLPSAASSVAIVDADESADASEPCAMPCRVTPVHHYINNHGKSDASPGILTPPREDSATQPSPVPRPSMDALLIDIQGCIEQLVHDQPYHLDVISSLYRGPNYETGNFVESPLDVSQPTTPCNGTTTPQINVFPDSKNPSIVCEVIEPSSSSPDHSPVVTVPATNDCTVSTTYIIESLGSDTTSRKESSVATGCDSSFVQQSDSGSNSKSSSSVSIFSKINSAAIRNIVSEVANAEEKSALNVVGHDTTVESTGSAPTDKLDSQTTVMDSYHDVSVGHEILDEVIGSMLVSTLDDLTIGAENGILSDSDVENKTTQNTSTTMSREVSPTKRRMSRSAEKALGLPAINTMRSKIVSRTVNFGKCFQTSTPNEVGTRTRNVSAPAKPYNLTYLNTASSAQNLTVTQKPITATIPAETVPFLHNKQVSEYNSQLYERKMQSLKLLTRESLQQCDSPISTFVTKYSRPRDIGTLSATSISEKRHLELLAKYSLVGKRRFIVMSGSHIYQFRCKRKARYENDIKDGPPVSDIKIDAATKIHFFKNELFGPYTIEIQSSVNLEQNALPREDGFANISHAWLLEFDDLETMTRWVECLENLIGAAKNAIVLGNNEINTPTITTSSAFMTPSESPITPKSASSPIPIRHKGHSHSNSVDDRSMRICDYRHKPSIETVVEHVPLSVTEQRTPVTRLPVPIRRPRAYSNNDLRCVTQSPMTSDALPLRQRKASLNMYKPLAVRKPIEIVQPMKNAIRRTSSPAQFAVYKRNGSIDQQENGFSRHEKDYDMAKDISDIADAYYRCSLLDVSYLDEARKKKVQSSFPGSKTSTKESESGTELTTSKGRSLSKTLFFPFSK